MRHEKLVEVVFCGWKGVLEFGKKVVGQIPHECMERKAW
jgi:hypothetical protein